MTHKAIFLDRDGTINKLVNNEAPKIPHKLIISNNNIKVLQELQKDYLLFIVSNQPDWAYGKNTLINILQVDRKFKTIMKQNNIDFTATYYCYHGRDENCICRKPKTHWVDLAIKRFDIDCDHSWFIGDRDTDIQCGQNARLKTILIEDTDLSEVMKCINPK